ncbi:MAG: fibronectin type III domain-containing protein [Legionella sp.]|nr:fibronectin type III domain-containing protein [Legionella sp.]
MKRIINILIAGILLLSPLAFAQTAPFFKIVEAGTPAAVDVILCLNGTGSLSCQNYHFSAQDVRISTTAAHHYPAVGIKVLTPGYRVTGCTPYPNGYCLFAASNTASAALHLSPPKNQTIIVTTPPPASAIYNSRFTVVATATSGLPIIFSSGGSCTNSGATYTITSGTGTCNVIANQPGNPDYKAAPTVIKAVTATLATQATLTAIATPSTISYNGTSALSSSGGSGTGAVTYAVTSGGGNCSISGTTLRGIGVGSCSVTATKAADANYQAATSAPISITVTQASQATLTAIATPRTISYNGTSALSSSGGSGTGAVTYAVTSGGGNCSISGTTLTATGVGSCSVTALKAADTNYQLATSAPIFITVTQASQATLTASATPSTISYNGTSTLSSIGGSGAGAVTYAVTSGSSNCSILGTMLTATGVGPCSVTATKAADVNYQSATSSSIPITITQASQATLTASATPSTISYNGTSTLSSIGGSGAGAVTYAVTSGSSNCSILGTTLTATGVGPCSVTATKAADVNYQSATSSSIPITITQASQAMLTAIATPSTIPYSGTSTLTTNGGSGTGVVTYAVTSNPGNCSISGATLTGTNVGSCDVTAMKAADANYQSAVSSPITVTVIATVPGAPTSVAANAGYASATVSWSAPANTGGVAIINYTITPYIGATAQPTTTVGNVLTTNISGLTNGSAYTFVVRAVNSVGTGSASAASNQVTPLGDGTYTVPAFPRAVIATAGPSTVTLTWAAPNNPLNGAVTGYTVSYGETSTSTYTTPVLNCQQTSATTCTITGLTDGISYTFTVSATNASGTGPVTYSSPATPTGTSLNANPANMALSGLGGGASRVITFTNNSGSSVTVKAVQPPTLPAGATLDSSSLDDCTNLPTLASGESCTITINPGATPTSTSGCIDAVTLPTPGVVTVDTSLDSVSANIFILGYGCQYQEGYIYTIDDAAPFTNSIGGKVASLSDQSTVNTVWSAGFITIWGIDDISTVAQPSPNTSNVEAAELIPGQLNCDAINDGACATNNIFVTYGPGTNYAVGLCKTTISGYTDWYLPSICDLGNISIGRTCTDGNNNMQNNIFPIAATNLWGTYWSSIEDSTASRSVVWLQLPGSNQATAEKNNPFEIRCVRALTS